MNLLWVVQPLLTASGPHIPPDGTLHPVGISLWQPRDLCIAIGFGLLLALPVGPALAADVWETVSSFNAKATSASWTRDGFHQGEVKLRQRRTRAAHSRPFVFDPTATPIANLRNLISLAEAGALNYDAVYVGAALLPPGKPTELTIAQIRQWVQDTPNQNHAIGRYQFIPATFERLVLLIKTPDAALFTADLQDHWADVLIAEAGYGGFLQREVSAESFLDNLAGIWAGLPLRSGKSAYDGIAGNHATLSRVAYLSGMASIFPIQLDQP